jgi:hypothetical protein
MVRVDDSTHAELLQLAESEGQTLGSLLAKAITAYRERRYWERFNEAAAALRSDPATWEEELTERRELDGTLADGLKDDAYPLPSADARRTG